VEPRCRVNHSLYAVVMVAYVSGFSTRKVNSLVAALGSQRGICKSQVSRICVDIDLQAQAFFCRSLDASGYAYLQQAGDHHGRYHQLPGVVSAALSRTEAQKKLTSSFRAVRVSLLSLLHGDAWH